MLECRYTIHDSVRFVGFEGEGISITKAPKQIRVTILLRVRVPESTLDGLDETWSSGVDILAL